MHRTIKPAIPSPSQAVAPPRVAECPVQIEGSVHHWRPFGKNVHANVLEVHIERRHVSDDLGGEVHPSRLTESDFVKFVERRAEHAAK